MLELGGTIYALNLDALEKVLVLDDSLSDKTIKESKTTQYFDGNNNLTSSVITTKEYDKPKEYDSSKYETIRVLFEVLLTYNDEFDDTLGFDRAMTNASLPFKITFNTLLNYGILSEITT
jgi:hypothetical protein